MNLKRVGDVYQNTKNADLYFKIDGRIYVIRYYDIAAIESINEQGIN